MSENRAPAAFVAADAAESWVLATGLPGFVDAARLDAKRALDAELERLKVDIAELEARRASLAAELDEARQHARTEGLMAAEQQIGSALARLAHLDRSLVDRAADAAIRAAETILRDQVRLDPVAVCALVRAAIARRSGATPLSVRVTPSCENLVATELSAIAIRVVGDPSLQHGDLVLDYADGQIDLRLDKLLEHMRAPIGAALSTGVADGG